MPTLPTRRRYKFANAPVVTTLAADMAAGATTFTLTSGTNWPGAGTGNFWVTIGAGTATEERILCSSTTGTTVTVASSGRGQDGTSAVAHSTGETVWVSWSATDADDANAHVSATGSDATVSIHGLDSGSNVVGTTDTQTLTNKTLTAPKISGSSSGFTTLQGASAASGTITIPATTDTLVGRATTDTLTNKSIDGSTNTLSNIPSTAIAGVSSSIQTQIDGKAAIAGQTFTGTVAAPIINATTKFQVNGTDVTGLTGAWLSWTPTIGGWGTSNYTLTNCRYIQIGKTVHFVFMMAMTGANTGGTSLTFTLPSTARVANNMIASASLTANAAPYIGLCNNNSTTQATVQYVKGGGTSASFPDLITGTVPAAWKNGDAVYVSGTYEAA